MEEPQIKRYFRHHINRAVKAGKIVTVESGDQSYTIDGARIQRGRLQVRQNDYTYGRHTKRWRPFLIYRHALKVSAND